MDPIPPEETSIEAPVPEVPRCVGEAPPATLPTTLADSEAWRSLDAWLFPPSDPQRDRHRLGVRTDGVVVVHHGVVIHERYGAGWDAERPHLAWSATKSFANTFAGIAVREGFDLDASICDTPPATLPQACAVTPRHLLGFSSGFDWHETYEGASPTTSSVLAMLYGPGRADMAAFVTAHRFRDPPGTSWQYSSGDTNVLTAHVGAFLSARHGERWPWAVLFDPIGMERATLESDGAGTFVGSSYLWAPPRDLARAGLLWLHDGCWGPTEVLPAGWVAWSTEVEPAMASKVVDWERGDVQGRQFWLNRPVPEIGQPTLPWEGVPEDAFAALGHWKQSVTVVPSLDLVVVRVADDRDGTFTHGEFLRKVLAAVEAP